jgi:hypothetical protein
MLAALLNSYKIFYKPSKWALCRFSFWSSRVQPVGSPFSRPCTSAGGVVASTAVNVSRIL